MIDSSLDLSVLFQELCAIRVLSEIFLDDPQKNLISLSSLQVFRRRKRLAAQRSSSLSSQVKKEVQAVRLSQLHSYQSLSLRMARRKAQAARKAQPAQSRTEDRPAIQAETSSQIDAIIKTAVQELDLDFLDPAGIVGLSLLKQQARSAASKETSQVLKSQDPVSREILELAVCSPADPNPRHPETDKDLSSLKLNA